MVAVQWCTAVYTTHMVMLNLAISIFETETGTQYLKIEYEKFHILSWKSLGIVPITDNKI